MSQTIASTAGRTWVYTSTAVSSDISAAGLITDGYYLGMKGGDMLIHFTSTGGVVTSHSVLTVTSTGVTLSAGTTIGLGS